MKTGMEMILEAKGKFQTVAALLATNPEEGDEGELAGAAACYALANADYFGVGRRIVAGIWPLAPELCCPEELGGVEGLAKAGALILMELERRAEIKMKQEERSVLILPGN